MSKATAVTTEDTLKVETESITEATPKAEANATKAVQGSVVYVGPTIPGVGTHNMVLNNGLTEGLKAAQEKEPAFKALIVPISELSRATNDITMRCGATYTFYEKVLNYKA